MISKSIIVKTDEYRRKSDSWTTQRISWYFFAVVLCNCTCSTHFPMSNISNKRNVVGTIIFCSSLVRICQKRGLSRTSSEWDWYEEGKLSVMNEITIQSYTSRALRPIVTHYTRIHIGQLLDRLSYLCQTHHLATYPYCVLCCIKTTEGEHAPHEFTLISVYVWKLVCFN